MPGMKKSMRPVPRPGTAREREEERGAVERGNRAAEREAREADSLKPLRRKAGGSVKKMRAGGGNMSSASLRKRTLDDSQKRERAIEDTYRDRGTAGEAQARKRISREIDDWGKDLRLIETYGRDAPNARSFNTRRAAGGAVKKMKAGGKCRGMGKATKGGNYSRG